MTTLESKKLFSFKWSVILLPISALSLAIGLGVFLYRSIENQLDHTAKEVSELNKLRQSETYLRKKLDQVVQESEALQSKNQNLKETIERLEKEKGTIIKQVRASVNNFESFRKSTAEGEEKREEAVHKIEEEKKDLMERMRKNNEGFLTEIRDLKREITGREGTISRLRQQLEDTERAKIVMGTAKLHYNLGNFYFRNKDYEAAATEYKKSLSYRPDDADTHYNLAVVFDEYLGDDKSAIDHYERYLSLKPKAPDSSYIKDRVLDLKIQKTAIEDEPLTKNRVPGMKN